MSTGMGGSPAASKVTGPAIFLMIVGGLTLAFAIYQIISSVLTAGQPVELPPDVQADPGTMEFINNFQNISGGVGVAIGVAWIVVGGVILFGAIQMKGLRSYGLAMTASILSLIPCVSPTSCCLIGIGAGVWSLVVLMDANVKAAFH